MAYINGKEVLFSSKIFGRGGAIVEVATLPTTEIDKGALYRTPYGVYWHDTEWHKIVDEAELEAKGYALESTVNDVSEALSDFTDRVNALLASDDTTLDELQEIVTFIKNNSALIEQVTTNKVNVTDIVDNLSSSATNKPLSAKQGKALKALIDAIVIPTVPTKISAFENDKGYITAVPSQYVTAIKANTDAIAEINEALEDGIGVASWNDLKDRPFYEGNGALEWEVNVETKDKTSNLCEATFGFASSVLPTIDDLRCYEVDVVFDQFEAGLPSTQERYLLSEFKISSGGERDSYFLLTLKNSICDVKVLILRDYDSFGGAYMGNFNANGIYLGDNVKVTNYDTGSGLESVRVYSRVQKISKYNREIKKLDNKFLDLINNADFTSVNQAISAKLNKNVTPNRLYGVDSIGNQEMVEYGSESSTTNLRSIVLRNMGGGITIKDSDINSDTDAVNRKYVKNAVAPKSSLILAPNEDVGVDVNIENSTQSKDEGKLYFNTPNGSSVRLTNIATPKSAKDAANKKYVDDALANAGGSGGGSAAIIDVDALPTENINNGVFYRRDNYLFTRIPDLNMWSIHEGGASILSWNGVTTGKTTLDISSLTGEAGAMFVKISDEEISEQYLNGGIVTLSSGELHPLTIDAAMTFPGLLNYTYVVVITDADTINSALGLPAGYLTNGTYFYANNVNNIYVAEQFAMPQKSGSGGGSASIIDVDTLPTVNINANAFYRVKTEAAGHYMLTPEGVNVMDGQPVEVITVETLPATGKPLMGIDYEAGTITAALYVRTSDSTVHFYVDETVSAMLEAPVGWSDASAMGLPYEIVSSPEEASGTAIAFVETVVYKYPLYVYAVDEWVEVKSDYSDFSALGGGGSCNCVIPTKVSELTNDVGYVTAYAFDGTYNATTNKAATVSTVRSAISSFEYGSEGLKYIVYDDYASCKKGECDETDVVIAETALGVPVTSILLAFENDDNINSVVIPKYVTAVNSAFKNCENLESVVFDDESQLKTIGLNAFNGCRNLKNITLPGSVTEIDQTAFNNCFYLPKINIPNGVTSIGQEAFRGCRHLTSIELPDSVTTIGNMAFDTCERLESITLSNSISTIGDNTFRGCNALENITIPNGVTSIGQAAFMSCIRLASVTIPDSVTYIGEDAFWNCNSLTSIVLPNGVTSLEKGIFTNCIRLSSITIPNSVTSIGDGAFSVCANLPSITIPNSVRSIGKQAFSGCNKLTSITVPEGVTSIAQEAFGGLAELTSITLPRSVTTIGANLVMYSAKFTDVYYAGTEEEWAAIAIDADNADLANATIHYNSEV